MDFRILGPLEVVGESGPVVLPQGLGRSLLALLILRAGQVVASERLIDELWGDTPPPTANKGLHNLISDLRARLRTGRDDDGMWGMLETIAPGYALKVDPVQVDANRFRKLVDESLNASAEEAGPRLRRALGMWRGPALADLRYEPFAQTEIATLEELRLTATERRVDADLGLGRHGGELIAELEGLVREHPYRERFHGQLMVALYRNGRQAQALEVYRRARRTLVEDLGIEPSPALAGLEQAILRQDPGLEPPDVSGVGGELFAAEPADSRSWLPPERRTVAVMFANLLDTAHTDGGADPEVVRRVTARCVETASQIVEGHGGTVEGLIGGVAVAVFGLPVAHEDDALRAVRAAAELREAAGELAAELGQDLGISAAVRVGISTGEVVVGEPEAGATAVAGGPVTVASRLQEAAAAGEVLLSNGTRRLLGDAVRLEPVEVERDGDAGGLDASWRLVDVAPRARLRGPDPTRPMVGRRDELARLRAAFDRSARERHPILASVLGEAGVGKSRLALEFVAALRDDAAVLTGRCPTYGHGITFWPLREIIRQGIDGPGQGTLGDEVGAQRLIRRLVGATPGDHPAARDDEDLFPAVRRVFEALAAAGPLVVVIEDVHWAEATFLDLVDHLVQSVAGPLLIVGLARPELLDVRPGWGQPDARTDTVTLEPLDPDSSAELVTARLAQQIVAHGTVQRILALGQGNPLFLEQLTAAVRDDNDVGLPPSVRALLAARLDRLGPAERDLLRRASVVGVEFSLEALRALVPHAARRFLDRHLGTLERRELIEPARRQFLGRTAFAFRHNLVQLAAQASMTREVRAELHERLARWLEAEVDDAPQELVGYHLEQAHLHLQELGLVDDRSRAIAVEAGERLARAGLRAYGLFDVSGAANLLSRAQALLPGDHPQRGEIMHQLAEAYPILGKHREAEAILSGLLEESDGEDRQHEQTLRLQHARVRLLLGPDPIRLDTIRDEAEHALREFDERSDDAGRALALFVLALVCRRSGAISEMEALSRRGHAAAQRVGHRREASGARWNIAWALQAGRTPVPQAIRECEELAPLDDTVHPGVLCEIAILRAMIGEFDEARGVVAQVRRLMVERWRARGTLMYPAAASARIATLAGDTELASHELRTALDLALEMNVREHASEHTATLTRVLAELGKVDEAEHLAAIADERAPAESVAAQAQRRAAMATVLSHHGQHRQAEELVREAIRLAPSDMLNLRADLNVELAQILQRAGRGEAALEPVHAALGLYERKGNTVAAHRARSVNSQLAGSHG